MDNLKLILPCLASSIKKYAIPIQNLIIFPFKVKILSLLVGRCWILFAITSKQKSNIAKCLSERIAQVVVSQEFWMSLKLCCIHSPKKLQNGGAFCETMQLLQDWGNEISLKGAHISVLFCPGLSKLIYACCHVFLERIYMNASLHTSSPLEVFVLPLV